MQLKEKLMRGVFALAALCCVAAVALICVFLFWNGLPFFGKYSAVDFLTGTRWAPADGDAGVYGILPMIVGSCYVTAGALLVGGPIGILAGIYLARFCPRALGKVLTPMVSLMAGVPCTASSALPRWFPWFGGCSEGTASASSPRRCCEG